MASVWVAHVGRPMDVPIEQVHVLLYSYFPLHFGERRPYVWRLLAADRIGVISLVRPTANAARQVEIMAGRTYEFMSTYKRTRNRGGKEVRIDAMGELRERLIRFVGERGGAIGFVRLGGMREMVLPRRDGAPITLPIVDAAGAVHVTDADRFATFLAYGGPAGGKAYGCGAWWLPEVYDA